jgi:hypothetical protein
MDELYQFVMGYTRLYMILERLNGKAEEARQESDVREVREEDSRAVVLPVALSSENQSQSATV